MTRLESEQLQEDIITHCDGIDDELITELCRVIVNYYILHSEDDNVEFIK